MSVDTEKKKIKPQNGRQLKTGEHQLTSATTG